MSFWSNIRISASRFKDFHSRSSRSEFWSWMLFTLCFPFLFIFLNLVTFYKITRVATYVLSIPVACRRLHDSNRSGGWLVALPLLGAIHTLLFVINPVFYWFLKDSDPEKNRYGEVPT